MTGVSGTSANKKIHQYYYCVTQRRHGDCKKKPVKKSLIEDTVIDEVLAVLTDENVDKLARRISDLSMAEGNTDAIKRLNRLIKENEKAMANLIAAIEKGKAVEVFSAQIEKRQKERADLETQISQEKMINTILTYEAIKFFFEKFKNGDANDSVFRTTLIDTFINKVYVFDDEDARVEIYCNASDEKIISPLDKLKSSPKEQLAPPTRIELITTP